MFLLYKYFNFPTPIFTLFCRKDNIHTDFLFRKKGHASQIGKWTQGHFPALNIYMRNFYKTHSKRYLQALCTLTQIFYTCPLITPFWDKILRLYYDLIEDRITNSPLITLLLMLPGFYIQDQKSLLWHFLTSACTVIARAWHKSTAASFAVWACKMDSICHMENIISWETGKTENYTLTWSVWNHFPHSQKFASYLWFPCSIACKSLPDNPVLICL